MKSGIRLVVVMLLLCSLFMLPACTTRYSKNNGQDKTTNTEKQQNGNGSDVSGEENGNDENTPSPTSTPETKESQTPAATPKETVVDRNAVKEVGWEDTVGAGTPVSDLDQYGLNKRLLGLIDDSNPHGVEDYSNGIVATRNAFVLNERYTSDIIAGLTIGSSFDDIRKAIGEPGWETDNILLYRNWNYYLMFHGNQKADYAVLIKAPDTKYDKYILSSIIQKLNAEDYTSLEEAIQKIDPDGTFFTDSGFINGGGYYASSNRGINIVDFDEKYIEVYNNYQGSLFDHTADKPRFEVRFIDQDMTINIMLSDFNRYLEVEELFKNEAVVSPDGNLSAVYEWIYSMDQHFIVRTLDNSIQDRYIYAATVSKFYWLNNSHLLYVDSTNEVPYAIDVNFSDPSPINLLYEAGIIKERDVDFGKYKFEITGVKNGVISLKDTQNKKNYNIQFIEDKNGALTFKSK
ncbi:MAG: hypothetical protein N2376_01195 [Clostridia bacterium]|nr:hypothetical protein [Clostridia bacterium]